MNRGSRNCHHSHTRPGLQRIVLGLVALLGLARPAHAVDGVIEINQVRALAGGVTAGDSPGFPVTVGEPGSYRLTGNLTVPDADVDAIAISAAHVTLDLNGFVVSGPTVCAGTPLTCAPTGSSRGVRASGLAATHVAVLNGSIHGMGGMGIQLLEGARVENVRVVSNAEDGINVGSHSTLRNNTALTNGGRGLATPQDSTVSGNVANANGGAGILAGSGCTVTANTADANGDRGFAVGGGSTIIGNTARGNTGVGLSVGQTAGYANNVLAANNGGNTNPQVLGLGTQTGANVCGDTLCP